MKKSIFIFASDERSTLELANVVRELVKTQELIYFFLYSIETSTQHPRFNLENFQYDSNSTQIESKYHFNSLNYSLPFIPDIVLITRENWHPEKEILLEFKQAGSIIVNLENSSWLYNNIKTKLELLSRKTFPTNIIDVYLDHSKWVLDTKALANWSTFKSKVVGNPKFDSLLNVTPIKKDKPIIILYGSMEINIRPKLLSKLKLIQTKLLDKFDIYYKPHPKEFEDFSSDFSEDKLVQFPLVKVIKSEQELQTVVTVSDINIGIYSSVLLYALLLNKKIVYLDSEISGVSSDLTIESFRGHEYNFWAPIIGVKSFEEFEYKIGLDFIQKSIERNSTLEKEVQNSLIKFSDDLIWTSETITSDSKKLIPFYDEYGDFKASERVVNLIKQL